MGNSPRQPQNMEGSLMVGYDGTEYRAVQVDTDGNLIFPETLGSYKASDIDTAADTKYYGFIHSNGAWYIMKEVTTAGSYRFTKGDSAYTTAWTGRVGHTYGYYDVIF